MGEVEGDVNAPLPYGRGFKAVFFKLSLRKF